LHREQRRDNHPDDLEGTVHPQFREHVGTQYYPQTIGLANGNILVVWTDTYGPSPVSTSPPTSSIRWRTGRSEFQLNAAATSLNEERPEIAIMPDGGFVMAYRVYKISGVDSDGIEVERFDSAGHSVASNFIAAPIPSSAQGNQYDLRHKISSMQPATTSSRSIITSRVSTTTCMRSCSITRRTTRGRCTTTSRTTEVM